MPLIGFFSNFAWQGWRPFDDLGPDSQFDSQARAMTFLGIVSGQVGCVFTQRDGSFAQRLSLTSNAWIRWGLLFELALALTLVYVPGINGLFSMEGVPPAWLAILPIGAAAFFLIDHARRIAAARIDTRRGSG